MAEFMIWLMVSSVTMIALYGCYVAFLSHLCQPVFNRVVLLAIYAVSFVSLFMFRCFFEQSVDPVSPSAVVIAGSISKATVIRGRVCIDIATWVYFIGATIVLLRRIREYIVVRRIIAKGERRQCDGYSLVLIDDEKISPFSLCRYIVVSRVDMDTDSEMILAHERSHISSWHWVDLLVADIVLIVQWFNPVAWMIRNELKYVHEFQADEKVVASGYDPKSYQLMLIGKAVGRRVCFAGNSLGHGKLKRRLQMMTSRPTSISARLRVLVMLPVLMALAFAANTSGCRRFFVEFGAMAAPVPDIKIRKNNAPIRVLNVEEEKFPTIFIDGKEVDRNNLNELNPSDIKSITVLKNDSENGTIVIETK